MYGPVNGHTRHKCWHGKHMSLAGAISAKHILAIHIPPCQQAVSCRRHDAYAYTYRMVRSRQVPLPSITLIYISNQLHIYSIAVFHAIVDGSGAAQPRSLYERYRLFSTKLASYWLSSPSEALLTDPRNCGGLEAKLTTR